LPQSSTPYAERLRDPRWQRKRLEVMQRDEFTCQECFSSEKTLNVHHGYYIKGNDPWDYPMSSIHTLCEECHEAETGNGLWAKICLTNELAAKGWLFGQFQWIAYMLSQLNRPITPRGLMLIFMNAIRQYEKEGLPPGCVD
jgi:hypothetical protein